MTRPSPIARGMDSNVTGANDWRTRTRRRAPFLVACVMLLILCSSMDSSARDVFTLEELNSTRPRR